MIAFKQNRFIQAFVYLMVISAGLHICIAFLHFVISSDISAFNFFRIIELDIFYPQFVSSIQGNYLAALSALVVYLLALVFLTKKK